MHDQLRFFAALPDTELLSEVESLAARRREGDVALIASLAEVDARQLYLGLGYDSLFTYCHRHLRLSEHEAYTRMEAARAVRRFPVVLDLLASGELTMTTLALLARRLTEENYLILLDAARGKTKREVLAQVAELDPRPDVDSWIVPLGNGRYRLEVTVPEETYRDLRRLQELMRHAVPTGDPAELVSRALSMLREHVERRKLADVARPRSAARSSRTRYIPAAVRREVWKRDAAQCAFVGTSGRCAERGFLELHHVVPFADGGPTSVENLQLRCRAHNQHEAEQHVATGS
jgi:5-methylcytosine-specific restriction endonuclease McrA